MIRILFLLSLPLSGIFLRESCPATVTQFTVHSRQIVSAIRDVVFTNKVLSPLLYAAGSPDAALHNEASAPDAGGEGRYSEQQMRKVIAEKDEEIDSKKKAIMVIVFLMVTKLFFMILSYIYWRKRKNLVIANLEHQRRIEELEHQRRLSEERNRIAREMHDDLGTTITTTLMAVEMMQLTPEAKAPLDMIRRSSKRMHEQLNEIVWNLNMNNDNLVQLSNYILRFAREFLTEAGIQLTVEENLNESNIVVESHKRRSIYLIMKETLNNVVKHSGTAEVEMGLNYKEPFLSIQVVDKGKGFDVSGMEKGGNGLKNIKRSIGELNGTVTWDAHPHAGTKIAIEIPMV